MEDHLLNLYFAHVDTSRDPLGLSSNLHLATTESKAGSNDCYLQEPERRSSLCLGTSNLISEIRACHQFFLD